MSWQHWYTHFLFLVFFSKSSSALWLEKHWSYCPIFKVATYPALAYANAAQDGPVHGQECLWSRTVRALHTLTCPHDCSQKRNQLGQDRTMPQQSCETNQTGWRRAARPVHRNWMSHCQVLQRYFSTKPVAHRIYQMQTKHSMDNTPGWHTSQMTKPAYGCVLY